MDDKVIPLLAEPHFSSVNVYCAEEISLAPQTETSISGTKLPLKWCQIWGIQFIPTVRKTALEIFSSSVENDGTVALKVFNSSPDTLLVRRGCRLAHARPLTECDSLFCVDTSGPDTNGPAV